MKPLYVKKNGVVYKISGNGMPASYPAENVEYDNTITSELQATDVQSAIDELSIRQDTNTKNTAYGTCDTAGNVKDKVATLSNATNWVLEVGTIVGIRFTYTNTYTPSSGNAVTLNVNNTGAKNIRYGNNVWTGSMDIKCPTAFGEADQTIYYMYDGTYWVWVSHSKDNDTLYNFVGREFRSCNFNDAGLATGFGGDANLMVVNGVYYYNSNGPSTSIGASADDGSVFVHTCDDGYVVQIAQNYETGNIFVRSMNDNVWGAWKKPNANITGNNAVLTADKTPFLTRQTLNPTGFSGYVREKLIGASYAWNQLITDGNFTNSTKWECSNGTFTISGNVATITCTIAGNVTFNPSSSIETIANHKYIACVSIESTSGKEIQLSTAYSGTEPTTTSNKRLAFIGYRSSSLSAKYPRIIGKNMAVGEQYKVKCFILSDLTLAFGSTIADYLYSLTNNGGITKLRDMGFPIDKYTAYGYGLYSVKTSGKKITFKNLVDYKDFVIGSISGTGEDNNISTIRLRSPFIRVAPNTTYAFSTGNSLYVFEIHEYVAEGNWIKYTAINATSGTLTVSANTNLVKVLVRKQDNSAIYVNDNPTFQMEKGLQATAYTPYAPITYPLGNDELRGKFDLVNGEIVASGDVKESNGGIDRVYGIVDLGSLNDWARIQGSDSNYRFRAIISLAKLQGNYGQRNTLCALYALDSRTDTTEPNNKEYILTGMVYSGSVFIVIRDDSYTDAATFKTAMNGVYLVYELATPTTEQSTPFADPMSLVGATTEEYIDTRDIPCPVGAERQYMGQSEDIIEIPSMPLADGDSVLHCQKSGNEAQYYWSAAGTVNGLTLSLVT